MNFKKNLIYFSHLNFWPHNVNSKKIKYKREYKNLKKKVLRKIILPTMKNNDMKISELVKKFGLNLTISGKSYKILCPFHEEKTPSLILNDELGVYHCFGCGASGNIYTLNKWLSSKDSVKKFHESEQGTTSIIKKQFNYYTNYKKFEFSNLTTSQSLWALQISWTFFMENLQKNNLLKFLIYSRGISICSSRIFGLGYATKSKRDLLEGLINSNFHIKEIIRTGLIYSNKEIFVGRSKINLFEELDPFTDVFRDRWIIPIRNNSGVIVGFGGRLLNRLKLAKYINSPNSVLFKKKRILFSEDITTEFINDFTKTPILTEGYLDSIGLFQNGIKSSLASLGTSVGIFQLMRFHLLSKNYHVLVYLDSDKAGKIASKKIFVNVIDQLKKHFFCISVIDLKYNEKSKDPDEFVYYNGSVKLTNDVFNYSLPIAKWYENILRISLINILVNFFCLNKIERIHKFFDIIDVDLMNKKFFASLYARSLEYHKIDLTLQNYSIKVKPRQKFYFTNRFPNKNKKQHDIKRQYVFNNIESSTLLFSFLFPKLKDDITQINFLNEFIYLDYDDQRIQLKNFTGVLDFKYRNIWFFYTSIFKIDYNPMASPEHLKNFLLYRFNSLFISSIQLKHLLQFINKTFQYPHFSNLTDEKKKIDKILENLSNQVKKVKSKMDIEKKSEIKFKLNILYHRNLRIKKISEKINVN